ncbi:MAG: hypothetical protein ACXVIK_09015 [Halobacteriota archaeon]
MVAVGAYHCPQHYPDEAARVRFSNAALITKTRNHIDSAAGTLTKATAIEARNTIGELNDLHVLARMNCVVTVFGRRR